MYVSRTHHVIVFACRTTTFSLPEPKSRLLSSFPSNIFISSSNVNLEMTQTLHLSQFCGKTNFFFSIAQNCISCLQGAKIPYAHLDWTFSKWCCLIKWIWDEVPGPVSEVSGTGPLSVNRVWTQIQSQFLLCTHACTYACTDTNTPTHLQQLAHWEVKS